MEVEIKVTVNLNSDIDEALDMLNDFDYQFNYEQFQNFINNHIKN